MLLWDKDLCLNKEMLYADGRSQYKIRDHGISPWTFVVFRRHPPSPHTRSTTRLTQFILHNILNARLAFTVPETLRFTTPAEGASNLCWPSLEYVGTCFPGSMKCLFLAGSTTGYRLRKS